ncbi:heparan-alpha-glucosaminide N-acetyltransferase domain-containing protein [Niabella hibiscisoli]|uniref:heparan-alpha-glucosaminide N-acetyltransferase domain-containing protein n=1 Tax=Niabella hibiscisoli TaxID=1825928 RepID=UPI001F10D6E6|nr:heparan-alpha-glucosaminide N-acetyltransferase domain-containing protein [Niabella hibiscisoli]MCH5719931.1 heparan-alpha-glucosaminide N-acetyltransferase domain-containing protein [Niabella hibiscisoli]
MLTPTQSRGFSLARGFIVFIMPAVHSVMLYSSDEVKQGWLGIVLGFLAEGPGAQLFMLLMGIFIVLGRTKTNRQIVVRSLQIGGLGYLLNLLRLVIPYYLHLLPEDYLVTLAIGPDAPVGWQLLMIGDILQFAALAYLFCALLHKYCPAIIIILIVAIIVWWISPYTWNINKSSNAEFVQLLTGLPLKHFSRYSRGYFFPCWALCLDACYN